MALGGKLVNLDGLKVVGDAVGDLKSKITEQTYNIVSGMMDGMTINSSGRLIAGSGTMLFWAPVTANKYYNVRTNEASMVCGFASTAPAAGDYLYNNQRIIQSEMVIQAPISGYLVVRATTPFTLYQIAEGQTVLDYLPTLSAVDYTARAEIATTNENVEELHDDVFSTDTEIYTDSTAGSTLSDYTLGSFYSIAEIPAGYKIKTIEMTAPNGSSPYLALIYNDNGYKVEYYGALSAGTGSSVVNNIGMVVKHNCLVCIGSGFKFVVDNTQPKPYKFGIAISGGEYVVSSAEEQASGIKYAVSIVATAPSLEGRLDDMDKIIVQPEEMAASLSMFETIGVCGDSYAEGVIVTSDSHATNHYMSWGKNLERQMGNSVTLFAKSGVKAGEYIDDSACLPALVADTAKQLYIISLGHNDMYNHTAKATFIENYYTIIDAIQEHAPDALIVLCRQSRPYADYDPALNTAIDEIGEHYGVPVIDPEKDPYTSSKTWLNTMVSRHPTFTGYSGMAQAINRQFARATVEYFDYFKEYTGL